MKQIRRCVGTKKTPRENTYNCQIVHIYNLQISPRREFEMKNKEVFRQNK